MAKSNKKDKNYFVPLPIHNMPMMMAWGGNSNFNEMGGTQTEYMQSKQNTQTGTPNEQEGGEKGKGFMQGMQGMSQSGGVGTIIGAGINEATTDEYGRQSELDGRAAGYWQGTSQGAQMGSSFGPWGMLIGAAVGGIAGGIGGARKAKQKNKEVNAELQANAGPAQISAANPYARANGGPMNFNEYNGNSHENGGIPLGQKIEVEGGEANYDDYVFSERLGFAQKAKRIRSKYVGREDDKYAKTAMDKELRELMAQNETARLAQEKEDALNSNLQTLQDIQAYGGKIKCENGGLIVSNIYKKELDNLAKVRKVNVDDLIKSIYDNTKKFGLGGPMSSQEENTIFNANMFKEQYGTSLPNNQQEQNMLQYGYGGRKKFVLGGDGEPVKKADDGEVDMEAYWAAKANGTYSNELGLPQYSENGIMKNEMSDIPLDDEIAFRQTTPKELKTRQKELGNKGTGDKTPFTFGNEEGALLASNLPAMYNLVMGFKPSKTTFKRVDPELISLKGQRDMASSEMAIANAIALENARNVGGGSGSVLASLASAAAANSANRMKVLSDSYQQEALQNTAIKNQAHYTNNQIANEEIIANEQNKAMADTTRGVALSDMGQNYQGYIRDKKLDKTNKKNNEQSVDIINSMVKNYQWGKDPESDKWMIKYINANS